MTDSEIRALNAQQLKDNPLLQEILDQVQAEAIKAWTATGADGAHHRELAWMLWKATNRFREVVQGAIDDGFIDARRAATAPLR